MTLWTPDGERPINRQPAPDPQTRPDPALGPLGEDDFSDLSPEEQEQARRMASEFASAREEILNADVADIIANHAMGLYELGAIHLTADAPNLVASRLAIDALGILVDGLEGRLGQHEDVLNEALQQIRLAFVQRSQLGQPSEPA